MLLILKFKGQGFPSLVGIEQTQNPTEGMLYARVLSRTDLKTSDPPHTTRRSHNATRTRDNSAYVMTANSSEEEMIIPTATVLGEAEEMRE
jgi:hypothetical protein